VVDAHLKTCAACRRFANDAAHVTRLARTAVAAPEPDVVAAVLAAAHDHLAGGWLLPCGYYVAWSASLRSPSPHLAYSRPRPAGTTPRESC
jgi:hypothetical protein